MNADECMMTRIQEMSLNYHFKIEQEAGSSTFAFFGFNGAIALHAETLVVFGPTCHNLQINMLNSRNCRCLAYQSH